MTWQKSCTYQNNKPNGLKYTNTTHANVIHNKGMFITYLRLLIENVSLNWESILKSSSL